MVYLDTLNGNDARDGHSEANAVKTYSRAMALAAESTQAMVRCLGNFDNVYILSRPHEWSISCRAIRRKLNRAWRRN